MSRTKMLCGVFCGGLAALLAVAGEAQQRVLPTGTPTVLPRTSAQPTPRPQTAEESAAHGLGVALAAIDATTWDIVRSSWHDAPQCLAAVDAHLAARLPDLKRLVRTSRVMECQEAPESGRMGLRLKTDEARRAFADGYEGAAVALRSLREELADNATARQVLEDARSKQSEWQDTACRELAEELVKRSPGRPVDAPVGQGSQRDS